MSEGRREVTYLQSLVTSDGEVMALHFDAENGIVSLVYVTGAGEERGEQIVFSTEDMLAVAEMIDAASENIREGRD